MKGKYYENDFEEAFVELVEQQGWTHTFGEEIHRLETNALLEEDLDQFLQNKYSDLTDVERKRIIGNLRNTGGATSYLSLRESFMLYLHCFTFYRDDNSLPDMHIDYIDFENKENNIFRVVNQFTMIETKLNLDTDEMETENRRPDVLLFINGIPVCIIELKNPADQNADIYQAWEQICIRYKRDIPSLMKYCALSCISDMANTRLGTTYAPYEHYYPWKKVNNDDKSASNFKTLDTLIEGVYKPERILKILRDFVYFPDVTTGQQKEMEVVCRYPQFFATELLFESVLDHMQDHAGGDGKGGTYFGATGCGKTFTMLFLARQLFLRSKDRIGSPTILVIVDREDLERQSADLYCSSKDFLDTETCRIIKNRKDLHDELAYRKSGGFFIITIQKFCEEIGLLSDRSNIICFSDEAHRTQTTVGQKVRIVDEKKTDDPEKMGAYISYGFAYYLREAFPKATYVGFTGTPIDDTIKVFGKVISQYTMKESEEDGITVPLKYEARLARVVINEEQAKKIDEYYKACAEEGVEEEKIKKSKEAMASITKLLDNADLITKLAQDIVQHYEKLTANDPSRIQKAMIVCPEREIAYDVYKEIGRIRPQWLEKRRTIDDSKFVTEEEKIELQSYQPISMVNVVATRSKNDEKAMYDALGDESHRKELDKEFKKELSNFRIAIVVDMWITGFDVPSLSVMYNYKPLQKHTLIQTISRVNRTYPGKEYGLIVDYIGIRENMQSAMKQYGNDGGTTIEDLESTYKVFKAELDTLSELMKGFDIKPFFDPKPLPRLQCLQNAAEFVQEMDIIYDSSKESENGKKPVKYITLFRGHTARLKASYNICQPAGRLNDAEIALSQFFFAVLGIINKSTGSAKSIETMNKDVAVMLTEAVRCSGVETVLNTDDPEDVFSDEFQNEIDNAKLPLTKFQALVKLLKKAIKDYKKINKVQGKKFEEMLQAIIDAYNSRDNLTFTNDVATDTINAVQTVVENKVKGLIEQIKDLFNQLKIDKEKFRELGITFEEKVFYDILRDIRDKHKFEYADEKCIELARKIKALIDDSSVYADWLNNNNIRSQLNIDICKLIYHEGYPPEWDEIVAERVIESVSEFKGQE